MKAQASQEPTPSTTASPYSKSAITCTTVKSSLRNPYTARPGKHTVDELEDIIEWCIELGLPVTLKELGITEVTDEKLMAVANGSLCRERHASQYAIRGNTGDCMCSDQSSGCIR